MLHYTIFVGDKSHKVTLKDVVVIPQGTCFLLSMGKLDRLGWSATIWDGKMHFYPPGSEEPHIEALLLDDGLYHIRHRRSGEKILSEMAHKVKERIYPTKEGDEKETPISQLSMIAKFLALKKRDDGKPLTIWEPFVGSGKAGDYWRSLGYNVIHDSFLDSHDPSGPKSFYKSGRPPDYDFIITNPPFSLNRSLLLRIKHEPRFICLFTNDI
jgi:hypothetical protein